MKKGLLVVIEGIDGAGKTTQIGLLEQHLASQGRALQVEVINFPRYEDNLYGALIRRYLEGEFGNINEVNPYLLALAYAGDRVLAKPMINNWLNEGKIVIANRYVSSSKAHLGANLDEEMMEEFMEWINQLEYQTNGMPKPDLNILLKVDPKIGQQNALKDHQVDIHEKSLDHEEKAAQIYFELSKKEPNWIVIDCMKDGTMKSKDAICKEIIKIISNKLPT